MNNDTASVVDRFSGQRVLVIGDVMLDRFLEGAAGRLSPEAPAPVVDVRRRRELPGGAANTAANARALGASVELLAVRGADRAGCVIGQMLAARGVATDGLLASPTRATLTKARVVAAHQLLVRYDFGSTDRIDSATEANVLSALSAAFDRCDAVIVSDYDYGVLTPRVIAHLHHLQSRKRRVVLIDAKRPGVYRNARPTAVKPNYSQALDLLRRGRDPRELRRTDVIERGSQALLAASGAELVAVTLDSEGAIILQRGAPPHRCPPTAPHCASAVGAGDTFAAAFTLALAAGASGPCAGDIASAAAGQVVRKDGTATCTREDLLTALGHGAAASASHARALAEEYRRIGHRIVFTNGCFDLLHPGHVELLRRARALGDVLIVGLNSDESVRRRKGPRRPINSSEVRAAVLRGLRFVDDVIVFDDETPAALVEAIRPDVFVKGDDYTEADLPEAPIVRQYGGTVCLLPCAPDHSTSGLVRRIRAARRCAS